MIPAAKPNPKRAAPRPAAKPRGPMATRNQPDANIRTVLVQRWLPLLGGVTVCAALAAAVYAAWLYSPEVPVREVIVTGKVEHTTREELARASQSAAGNLLALDLQQVRADVKRLPWVRDALVRRAFPGRVEIVVEEHVPVALWQQDDAQALVNSHGEVFRADYADPLPLLAGPAGTAAEVRAQQQRFAQILGSEPVEVRLSARRAWQVKLADKTVLELGRNDAEQRLARFVTVRPLTSVLQAPGLKVDLRYATGMALTKTPEMLQLEQEQATRKKKA